ncbi:hypothetical protein BJF90_20280 [Pseudonocardia sp. CNS-004]|nr:hypothetical protein BJF90_20280 [Pseudonocardia sp. CNS-004]
MMDRPWSRVPSWVGAALRPELAGTIDGIIAAVRAEVPEYARPLTGRFGARITEGVSVALGQFLDLLGRDDPLGDSTVYRALGQLEHREGRTLAALQTAYQVGTRTLWQRLAASRTARQLPPEVIFNLAEALFGYIEQISAASVVGWADEEASQAGSLQARRHALVELLARPTPPAELEAAAAAAGWTVPARVAALVVDDAVAVAARLPGAVGADLDPVGMVIVSARGEADGGWLDRVRGATGERRAVLGPVVEPAQAHRSAALAQAAWPLHAAGASTATLRSSGPTNTCSPCCSRPPPTSPLRSPNVHWPRCVHSHRVPVHAPRRPCAHGSTPTATSPPPPPHCTCTRRPCATASPPSARRSAGCSTTPRPAWSWPWRCGPVLPVRTPRHERTRSSSRTRHFIADSRKWATSGLRSPGRVTTTTWQGSIPSMGTVARSSRSVARRSPAGTTAICAR